ncbi:hypothetical protein B0T26DRAFT_691048 [Lasiosphaeria miniovina]|uniref:Structure-specific endonuclease subunit SLX4 n=1 Tax=Lasiosphaeria miniovina TaxID=1954250 RepID=A0AA40BJ47_9PEZI|nr:uncharacterized protein B0T26DRAFT_691048 [Lasiosphaeria miniovina]KAK0735180.1 hypothetical protein B0T26DRAFT_691048 [Lasiosphaeria miniovina]
MRVAPQWLTRLNVPNTCSPPTTKLLRTTILRPGVPWFYGLRRSPPTRSKMASGSLPLSSPAHVRTARDESIVVISSSPEFPSIYDLLAKPAEKSALRSGSNAAPIPVDAIRTFTAAELFRFSRVEGESLPDVHNTVNRRSTSSVRPTAKVVIELSPTVATATTPSGANPKRRQEVTTRGKRKDESSLETKRPALVFGSAPTNASVVPGKAPGKKSRPSKTIASGQTVLPKGKVTKPAASEKAPRKRSERVSKHFNPQPPPTKSTPKSGIEDEPLALEPAMRRRTDWTPPPSATPTYIPSSPTNELYSPAAPGIHADKTSQLGNFKNLHDTYGRKEERQLGETAGAPVTNDVLGKRKLVEMVSSTTDKSRTLQPLPTRPKAPKKKPRTITDLATAAYRVVEESDRPPSAEKSKSSSLLGNIGAGSAKTAVANRQPGKNTKLSKKPANPKVSKKKAGLVTQVLLSPKSALSQVAKQDFVFGTASQLTTEEDPELLRALHEAMKASNQPDGDPFARSLSPVRSNVAAPKKARNKLWEAGARGEDGSLVDMEFFDLTDSPALPRGRTFEAKSPKSPRKSPSSRAGTTQKAQRTQKKQSPKPHARRPSSGSAAVDLTVSPPPMSHFFYTQDSSRDLWNIASEPLPEKPFGGIEPISIVDLDFDPPPSNQEHNQLLEHSQPKSSSKDQPDGPTRPKFELFTDAKLAKEVASYGFKAIKKRAAMIELLDRCWSSKNKTSLVSEPAEPGLSPTRPRGRPRKDSSVAAVPATGLPVAEAKRRGRPRKDATVSSVEASKPKATAAAELIPTAPPSAAPVLSTPKRHKVVGPPLGLEIADSESKKEGEDDPFASSPMSLPDEPRMFSSPPDVDVSIDEEADMSLLVDTPTGQQKLLFRYISKAVTTAPRATDPENPSWHEKMLMYDPVILEDLTAWLNLGQLDRVGFDGEVAPGDVKRWCESKSICCLWRVNLHGQERKRF